MTALYVLLLVFIIAFLTDIFITCSNNKVLWRHTKVLTAQNELLKKHVDNIEKYIMESEEEENGEDQN